MREARGPLGRILPLLPTELEGCKGLRGLQVLGGSPKPPLKPSCQSPPCQAAARLCAALWRKTETGCVCVCVNFPVFCPEGPEELGTLRVPGGPRGPVPIPGLGAAMPGFWISMEV